MRTEFGTEAKRNYKALVKQISKRRAVHRGAQSLPSMVEV